MKQYSAPQVKDVVLHTEHVMLEASKGNGTMTPAEQHSTEKQLGNDSWNDSEEGQEKHRGLPTHTYAKH